MRVLMAISDGVRRQLETSGSSANSLSDIVSVSGIGGRGLSGWSCWVGGGEGGSDADSSAEVRAAAWSRFIGSVSATVRSDPSDGSLTSSAGSDEA